MAAFAGGWRLCRLCILQLYSFYSEQRKTPDRVNVNKHGLEIDRKVII